MMLESVTPNSSCIFMFCAWCVYHLASVKLPPCHLVALQMSRPVRRAGLSSRATATCTSLSARPGRLPNSVAETSTPIWSASSRLRSSTLSTVSPTYLQGHMCVCLFLCVYKWVDVSVSMLFGCRRYAYVLILNSPHICQPMPRTTSGLDWMIRPWRMTSAGLTALLW